MNTLDNQHGCWAGGRNPFEIEAQSVSGRLYDAAESCAGSGALRIAFIRRFGFFVEGVHRTCFFW
jgi:hypothetical protein